MAPLNDTGKSFVYGEGYELERLVRGEWVTGMAGTKLFRAIGLTLQPHSVGSCFVVEVAPQAPIGTYRLVQSFSSKPGRFAEGPSVRGKFDVVN